jgi:hypothetical protein
MVLDSSPTSYTIRPEMREEADFRMSDSAFAWTHNPALVSQGAIKVLNDFDDANGVAAFKLVEMMSRALDNPSEIFRGFMRGHLHLQLLHAELLPSTASEYSEGRASAEQLEESLIDEPCVFVTQDGVVLAWYLPEVLGSDIVVSGG